MKQTKYISKTVLEHEGDWPPEDAAGALAWFQTKLDDVPQEFRGTVRIVIGATENYGSGYATIEISYARPETDDEKAERERQAAYRANNTQAQELRMLAALQAKYGQHDA